MAESARERINELIADAEHVQAFLLEHELFSETAKNLPNKLRALVADQPTQEQRERWVLILGHVRRWLLEDDTIGRRAAVDEGLSELRDWLRRQG